VRFSQEGAMAFAVCPAFFFTVVLLVATAYFLLGGLPLLVRHARKRSGDIALASINRGSFFYQLGGRHLGLRMNGDTR
jgi:hypothetical protein